MCGRFNLTAPGELIAEEFDLDEAPLLKPRFNIAPSQPVATIGIEPATAHRSLIELVWGFAPRRQINARSETAERSPAFRDAFARRRCLIAATGFYEWREAPGSRPQPWLFHTAVNNPAVDDRSCVERVPDDDC